MSDHKSLDIGHVAARLVGVALPMGLSLDEVIVEGEKLHVESDPFAMTLAAPGTLEVRVSRASLAAFLDAKAPGGLRDFQVRFDAGLLQVEAVATVIISLNVGAVCKLRIEEGSKLYVDLVRVDAIGGPGVFNMVQRQLDGINPVLDASDLPFAATLSSAEPEGDWLVIRGTIAPR